MKSKVKFSRGFILLLILTMLSCIQISLAETSHLSDDAIKGKLLYEDNFSTSKDSLFSYSSNANQSNYFENGKYRIVVNNLNYWAKQAIGNNSSDIIMQIQAIPVSGPNDNAYGVIFRKADWNNYYVFLISGDGYYQIAKKRNGKWIDHAYQDWTYVLWKKSGAIHLGKTANLIRVSCAGNQFKFYVNDIKIEEFTDNDYIPMGKIGLIAGTNGGTQGAVTIDFDDLKVWEISKQ
jgi:hypothetical protein